jgi:hypothetical protein
MGKVKMQEKKTKEAKNCKRKRQKENQNLVSLFLGSSHGAARCRCGYF